MAFSDFSYSGKSYSLPGSIQADAIYVGDSDTKLFVLDWSTDTVHQLNFGTAKEVDTLSDSGTSLDVSGTSVSNADLFVRSDLLVVGVQSASGTGNIHEYDLSTGWDVSSGTLGDNHSTDESFANDGFGWSLAFGFGFTSDGTGLVFSFGAAKLEDHSLTTGFDLTSASYVSDRTPTGLASSNNAPRFFSDGSFFLLAESNVVSAWPLSTANDLTTSGAKETLDVSSESTGINSIALSSDDSRLYVANGAGTTIYQYDGVATANTENSDSLTARYVDLESREPKPTALIAPGDVQRSIDTHIQNLLDFTHEWTCPIAVQIDELDNYVMGDTFNLTADAPGLRSGKNLRLVEIDATSALPHVPIRFTFRGKP